MSGVLLLGLLFGLQHALEADHVAAVASLATRSNSIGDAARWGAAWGIGHSVTLFVVGGAVLLLGTAVSDSVALLLEAIVGLMLLVLGGDVLLRMWRQRVHFHVHRHGGEQHLHAHSHQPGIDHPSDRHQHRHLHRLPLRSLLVGMVHGLAGSAALMLLALSSVDSIWQGFAYILTFALGSIIGMASLAAVISLPLRWSARSLTWAHNGLTALLGLVTVTLGIMLLEQTGSQMLALHVAA